MFSTSSPKIWKGYYKKDGKFCTFTSGSLRKRSYYQPIEECRVGFYDRASCFWHAEGVTRCINDALADAGILPVEIDYINAHGTGTPNNDKVESMGFLNVFGDKIPPFSSTKSYTGHTLGASGAIEAVYCVLSMIHRELYPNLRTSNPAPEIAASLVTEYRKNIPVKTVISSSYGFGGNCTSLILSAV